MLVFAAALSVVFIVLAECLGPKKPCPEKGISYECGRIPFEAPSGRHAVKFYMAAILFVIFDIELIFLFPWAVVLREAGLRAFLAALFFLFSFEIGFLYAWKKGALEWK